jgi:hypothetical protein
MLSSIPSMENMFYADDEVFEPPDSLAHTTMFSQSMLTASLLMNFIYQLLSSVRPGTVFKIPQHLEQ